MLATRAQLPEGFRSQWGELRHQPRTRDRDAGPVVRELAAETGQRVRTVAVRAEAVQQRVSLLENAAIAQQVGGGSRIQLRQECIEQPAPALGPGLDQLQVFRPEQHDRADPEKPACRTWLAIDAGRAGHACSTWIAGKAHGQDAVTSRARHSRLDEALLVAPVHQVRGGAGARRASQRESRHRLEHIGLALSLAARYDIKRRAKMHRRLDVVAEAKKPEPAYGAGPLRHDGIGHARAVVKGRCSVAVRAMDRTSSAMRAVASGRAA